MDVAIGGWLPQEEGGPKYLPKVACCVNAISKLKRSAGLKELEGVFLFCANVLDR